LTVASKVSVPEAQEMVWLLAPVSTEQMI